MQILQKRNRIVKINQIFRKTKKLLHVRKQWVQITNAMSEKKNYNKTPHHNPNN